MGKVPPRLVFTGEQRPPAVPFLLEDQPTLKGSGFEPETKPARTRTHFWSCQNKGLHKLSFVFSVPQKHNPI